MHRITKILTILFGIWFLSGTFVWGLVLYDKYDRMTTVRGYYDYCEDKDLTSPAPNGIRCGFYSKIPNIEYWVEISPDSPDDKRTKEKRVTANWYIEEGYNQPIVTTLKYGYNSKFLIFYGPLSYIFMVSH